MTRPIPSPDPGEANIPLSLSYGERVRAVPKDCYRSAFRALSSPDPDQESPPLYVEGYVLFDDLGYQIPMAHAWLERDGEIIDPSLWAYKTYLDRDVQGLYFPGLRLTLSEVLDLLEEFGRRDEGDNLHYSLPIWEQFMRWDLHRYQPMMQAEINSHAVAYGRVIAENILERFRRSLERLPNPIELTLSVPKEDVSQ